MDGETFTKCPGCGQVVDPDDPENLRAVELVRSPPTFGEPHGGLIEGMGAIFHPGCFNRHDPNWKLAE